MNRITCFGNLLISFSDTRTFLRTFCSIGAYILFAGCFDLSIPDPPDGRSDAQAEAGGGKTGTTLGGRAATGGKSGASGKGGRGGSSGKTSVVNGDAGGTGERGGGGVRDTENAGGAIGRESEGGIGGTGTTTAGSRATEFFDDFESGLGKWLVSGKDWGLTSSTSRGGSSSFTDSPNGNFVANTYALAIMKDSIDLSKSVAPVFSYWVKDYIPAQDYCYLSISKDGGTTWTTLASGDNNTLSTWAFFQLDLSAYKTSEVKIRFELRANADTTVGDGAYIDDVRIGEKDSVRTPYPFSDDFESGLTNWLTGGIGEWGLTDSTARSGSHSFADSPKGNYPSGNYLDSLLAHPIDLSASTSPVMTFWYEIFLTNQVCLYVMASKDGGTKWDTLWSIDNNTISTWSFLQLDLSQYKSAEFTIRFILRDNGSTTVGDGVYIDDVEIKEK
jgi:hypothetical protein